MDLALEADTAQMHRWLVGRVPFRQLVTGGHARLLGPSRLARAFPTWFDMTPFAASLRRAEQHVDSSAGVSYPAVGVGARQARSNGSRQACGAIS